MCVIVLLSITEECTSERVVATCTLTASGFSFSEISTLLQLLLRSASACTRELLAPKHTKRQYEEEDNVKAKGNNTKRTRKKRQKKRQPRRRSRGKKKQARKKTTQKMMKKKKLENKSRREGKKDKRRRGGWPCQNTMVKIRLLRWFFKR